MHLRLVVKVLRPNLNTGLANGPPASELIGLIIDSAFSMDLVAIDSTTTIEIFRQNFLRYWTIYLLECVSRRPTHLAILMI